MRKLLLLFAACTLAILPATASADWMDDFDSYALGSGLHGQGGWHGWDGNPAFDAYVVDTYALSAPHSAEVAGGSDIVQEFTGYTSDEWVFTAHMYVPTAFTGTTYFLLLNEYNDGGPYNWSTQISFNATANTVVNDATGESLALIRGQWVELRIEINLDTDVQTMYYGDQLLSQSSWTEGISGGGSLNIAAVDLFANNATPVYWDDLSLLPGGGPIPVETTTWGRVKDTFR